MSSAPRDQTLADYVALLISPALLMGLVASLVFFLVNVLYAGEFVERLRWILFFFVFGAVLIARMTMRDDTSSRAVLYGAPLGFLTWLGLQMFVEYPDSGGVRALSFLINAGLIGLAWWCAHRLTWDCTNIDEETDVNAEGLLQAAGLDKQARTPPSAVQEQPAKPESWWRRWQRYRAERDKKRTLGVWVVYFSLAALPLFGLGQALIPAADVDRRRESFWLLIVYVGCALALLLTTCFLGLRRYLRQRRLQMPRAMTGVWLTAGGSSIAALLLLGALLPRPNTEYSLFSMSAAKAPKRDASKNAIKGGRAGKGEGRPEADKQQDEKDDADSGGDKGQQKGQRGKAAKQGRDGQSARGDKRGRNNSQDRQDRNDGQNRQDRDAQSGRDRPASKDDGQRARSSSSSQLSASSVREMAGCVAPVLKWIVFALIGLVVLFFILRSGLRFLANFTDWARRLLEALSHFWAKLFGGNRQSTEEDKHDEPQEPVLRQRPFASFVNPFAGGRSSMALPELIRYTFAAAQAWARERGLDRQIGETPLEFADRVGAEVPAVEADLHCLALLYAQAVYARGGLPSNASESLRRFWERLQSVAEQPLSA